MFENLTIERAKRFDPTGSRNMAANIDNEGLTVITISF